MTLLPIREHADENPEFSSHPDCQDSYAMTISFYQRIGFQPPWISYYASVNSELVGAAAYKGKPVDNQVEIAYGVFPRFQNQGIGARICRELVLLAQKTDPSVIITARTMPEENFSSKILRKNNFKLRGTVNDPADGDVWEWEFLGY